MKLVFQYAQPFVLLNADDCRALARLCREQAIPEHFRAYSMSLEADAITMFRWKLADEEFDGKDLPASYTAGLTLGELLTLIEFGLPLYREWQTTYHELSHYLSQDDIAAWDWTEDDDQNDLA